MPKPTYARNSLRDLLGQLAEIASRVTALEASPPGGVTSVFSRTGSVTAATNDYTWAQINKTTSSIADITTKSHTALSDIGTNTHSQIDTHLASTSNPHSVTKSQVGLGNADNTSDSTKNAAAVSLTNKDLTSGTNTFPTFNQSTTGSAAKWTTARNLAGNSVDGSANVAFSNKFIVQGTTDTGLSGAQFLGSLGTGIVKNTTTTGVLSIAVAGDFPTLNQNTTGSAATLTTARAIYGNNFDGSAALTQVIASTYGGTGNGFAKFSGPATSEKTFTLPNASSTILTDNAAVTVAQGGTGATTLTGILKGNGTSAVTAVTAPSGTIVGDTDTQTLTNKTLTSPAITTPTGIVKGDVGLGNVDNTSDATKDAATATLTNKTIDGDDNTLQDIPASAIKQAAWTTFVPSWTNLTAGAGTNAGRYMRIGNTVFVRVKWVFGAGAAVGSGPQFELPVAPLTTDLTALYSTFTGDGIMIDDNTGANVYCKPVYVTTNSCAVRMIAADVTNAAIRSPSATSPWTWATNDSILINLMYEAA